MIEIVLGARYRDVASGFIGACTAVTEYLGDGPSVRLTAQTGATVAVLHERFPPGRLVPHEDPSAGFGSST